ncbi:MAG TPA: hypothetical protein VF115_16405 [Acidimicrobiia bacterium]
MLILALFLVGCGASELTETTEPEASTTSEPTTTSTPTTTTTPPTTTTTLDATGVLNALLASFAAPTFSARADLAIEVSVGDVVLTGSGDAEIAGDSSYMRIALDGFPTEEIITVGGVDYESSDEGPWVVEMEAEDPFAEQTVQGAAPLEDLKLVAFLKTLGELEHLGTVEEGDQLLHRIGLPQGRGADPVAFGYEPDDDATVEMTMLATPTGLPHEIRLTIDDRTDSETPFTMTMVWTFTETGIPVSISQPDEVWLTHTASESGYSIAHPQSWEVDAAQSFDGYTENRYYGLQGEELVVWANEIVPPGRVPLNDWLDGFRDLAVGDGFDVGNAVEYEVGVLPARKVTYTGQDEQGTFVGVYVVVQTDTETVFEFLLFGDADREAEIDGLLSEFLSTFDPEGGT